VEGYAGEGKQHNESEVGEEGKKFMGHGTKDNAPSMMFL
jgi:hypothetical protein